MSRPTPHGGATTTRGGGITMDSFEARAQLVLNAVYRGAHHVPDSLKKEPKFWALSDARDFATYDFDLLTRFVFACHDLCVRGSIAPSGPGRIKIVIHDRTGRSGQMYDRHPTIEAAIENYRAGNDSTQEA